MQVRLIMIEKLEKAFQPTMLNVIDESDKHVGHVGHRPEGETHFKVVMQTGLFSGLSRLEMQRNVFEVLKHEMKNKIHALSLELSA